jgi:uncharacterized membrane protein
MYNIADFIDSINPFYLMGLIILTVYIYGIMQMTKARKNYKPKEKEEKQQTDEVTQEQAYQVIQTLYNNQILTQQQYNKCMVGLGLFKA